MHIYGLHDPRDGALRYVGACKDMEKRLRVHMVYRQRVVYRRWIVGLVEIGLRPEIRSIEHVNEAEWRERERYWINFFRNEGADLVNAKAGGGGGATMLGRKFTDAHRSNLSRALMGHAVSDESIRKMVRAKRERGVKPWNYIGRINCSVCNRETDRSTKGKCQRCYNKARRPPKGHASRKKTQCKRGHPFAGDNLGTWGRNRFCRTCLRAARRRRYCRQVKSRRAA